MNFLLDATEALDRVEPMQQVGRVEQVVGLTVRVGALALPIGAMVRIESERPVAGEVVGFENQSTLVMLHGQTTGIGRGDRVVGLQSAPMIALSEDLVGRVINGLGQPIDGKGPLHSRAMRPLRPDPVDPMRRVPIDKTLGTGVRAVDAMLPVGRGQRMGIFSGPGVGKSTLLGMVARNTEADVSVIGLIGERGREVMDFIENILGPEGMARSVVVAATADEPALVRIQAALLASTIAEFFRDGGRDVLLLMDSVTRFAQAQRQVSLAAGEPPATKGYTPSVFSALPSLLERCGRTENGSITGFYTVLVEGDDLSEPVSDSVRAVLDGHLVLARSLANRGRWPAIDVLESISRVAPQIIDADHEAARTQVAKTIADWREVEDLVNIGAYVEGSNPNFDVAIAARETIDQFLAQGPREAMAASESRRMLLALTAQIQQARQKLAARPKQTAGRAAPARSQGT
ncbi:MAG: FliI/YscN family ATPase [Phycisphaeraceae bacterium]|nr:FliI/YscN family ATPase [Phycisphaeraceae bacterium]